VGYWLAVGRTGRGLATRATAALTRLAFTAPAIDHVEIHCDHRNVASARVPERLGYQLVDRVHSSAGNELLVWRLDRAEFVERVNDGQIE
jgi:RimJ/RimL family protein N-acetyltransferase